MSGWLWVKRGPAVVWDGGVTMAKMQGGSAGSTDILPTCSIIREGFHIGPTSKLHLPARFPAVPYVAIHLQTRTLQTLSVAVTLMLIVRTQT